MPKAPEEENGNPSIVNHFNIYVPSKLLTSLEQKAKKDSNRKDPSKIDNRFMVSPYFGPAPSHSPLPSVKDMMNKANILGRLSSSSSSSSSSRSIVRSSSSRTFSRSSSSTSSSSSSSSKSSKMSSKNSSAGNTKGSNTSGSVSQSGAKNKWVSLYKKGKLDLEDSAVVAEVTVADLKLVAKAASVDVTDITNGGTGSHQSLKMPLIDKILAKIKSNK